MFINQVFREELEYIASLLFYDSTARKKSIELNYIQEVFNGLTSQGIYYDTFLNILYPSSWSLDNPDNLEVHLKENLKVLGIKICMSYDEALNGVIGFHLKKIYNGAILPIPGMLALKNTLDWDCSEISNLFSSPSPLLAHVGGLMIDAYLNDPDEFDLSDLEEDIRQTAQAWMKLFPG
ncbi:MAG: hypothetical protein V9E96_20970 [Chitinophagaceae bacterium]